MTNNNQTVDIEELRLETAKVLYSKETLFSKYGDRCPYCDYIVPNYLDAKSNSLGKHMTSRHADKNPARIDKIMAIFKPYLTTSTSSVKEGK